MSGLPRQIAEVARELGHLLGAPALYRHGLKGAIAREYYLAKAAALGVARDVATEYLADAERELIESVWWFDVAEEASRRLMEVHAAMLPRPPEQLREAARRMLAVDGQRYTPADVDRLAREIEKLTTK